MAIVDGQLFSDHAMNATAFRLATLVRQTPTKGAGWHESAINRWIANPAAYREDRARSAGQ